MGVESENDQMMTPLHQHQHQHACMVIIICIHHMRFGPIKLHEMMDIVRDSDRGKVIIHMIIIIFFLVNNYTYDYSCFWL